MADIDVHQEAKKIAQAFARYFESDDEEFISNATKDIMRLIDRLANIPSQQIIEANKENGFGFITEADYMRAMATGDEIMRGATVESGPHAFAQAFEAAMGALVKMREINESRGERVKRKLMSFLEELKRLEDPAIEKKWMSYFVRQMDDEPAAETIDGSPQSQKPPRGVRPRRIAQQQRLEEIQAAIERYRSAGRIPPMEWYYEAGELARQLTHGQ